MRNYKVKLYATILVGDLCIRKIESFGSLDEGEINVSGSKLVSPRHFPNHNFSHFISFVDKMGIVRQRITQ